MYRTEQELTFDAHFSTILDFIQDNLSIENNFNASIGSRLFIGNEMFAKNIDDHTGEVYGRLSVKVKNFIIENFNLIWQIDEFLTSLRGIYNMIGSDFLTVKWKQIEACFGKQIADFTSAIQLDPRRVNVCLGEILKNRPKRSSILIVSF